jgi:hypothetical protein
MCLIIVRSVTAAELQCITAKKKKNRHVFLTTTPVVIWSWLICMKVAFPRRIETYSDLAPSNLWSSLYSLYHPLRWFIFNPACYKSCAKKVALRLSNCSRCYIDNVAVNAYWTRSTRSRSNVTIVDNPQTPFSGVWLQRGSSGRLISTNPHKDARLERIWFSYSSLPYLRCVYVYSKLGSTPDYLLLDRSNKKIQKLLKQKL